jgi:CO/xanthine dehydrogenase Mo-binding subunit
MADLAGANGQRPDFKVVGKPNLPGKLSYSLATGKAKFGIDYVFDNMLHAKFLRSPYANAAVKSVDVAAAKKIPGVVDVLTWEDEDLKNFGRRGGGGMGGGAPKPGAAGTAPPMLRAAPPMLPRRRVRAVAALEWAAPRRPTSTMLPTWKMTKWR